MLKKRRGLGGYADAKVCFRGLCLKSRARGCKPSPNTMELCPKWFRVTSGPYLKKVQKEGVWEDTRMLKSARWDRGSGAGLGGANDAWIRWNFARTHCKSRRAPISKSGVWEDTRMLNSVSGDCACQVGLVGANDAWIRWNLARTHCKSPRAPKVPSKKRRGLGGYADAKVGLRGLRLRSRARGCKRCPNTMELCPNSLQVTSGPYLKNLKKKGFGRIRGC